MSNAMTTPTKVLNPAIVNRFKYLGVADDVMAQQRTLLESLLGQRRIRLLMDAELLSPDNAYTALELVSDVQDGVWSELKVEAPKVDVCRRALQRVYLETLRKELVAPKEEDAKPMLPVPAAPDAEPPPNRNTDLRAVARAALTDLGARLDAAIPRTRDAITLAHLLDCRREVDLMLRAKS
jgi:hypothetical protein